ncbi:MAG: DUF1585 domain-containing protein, partial [Planctomycetota bacterium]|nr:DUF1585 domain-containing protein [Planctomycetota bacterium]
RDPDQITRSLTEKLVTYATGGPSTRSDRAEIERIVAHCRDRNYGFRTLVHAVVQSRLFLNK